MCSPWTRRRAREASRSSTTDACVDERRGDASRTHARAAAGRDLARARARRLALPDDRSVRRRVRARIVHRAADRHRDDSGARVRARAARRRRLGARGAGAAGERDRPAPARSSPLDGRAAPRGVRRAVPRRRRRRCSRRERLVELEAPAVGDPRATLARWAADPAASLRSSSATAPCCTRACCRVGTSDAARLPRRCRRRRIGRMAAVRARERAAPCRRHRVAAAVRPPAGCRDCTATGPRNVEPDGELHHRAAVVRVGYRRRPRHRGGVVHRARGRARCTSRSSRTPACRYFYLARNAARRAVGFCSFWRVLDELHINNLAVLPGTAGTRHRRGRCWRRVLAEGARLGAHRATLEVRRSNERARQLYERFGFAVAGVRRGYYTQPGRRRAGAVA